MFPTWIAQPSPFILNAVARRAAGIASKPDSTTVSFVPPATSASVNSTSVVGSFE